jgi:hypothetical protein
MNDDARIEYRSLTAVYAGTPTEVTVVRALLESHGIVSFVPDEIIKIVDPFITGANPLHMTLVCPSERAAEARRLIEESREAAPPEDTPESVPAGTQSEDIDRLGTRIRWAAVTLVTAPIGAFYGFRYLARCRTVPSRPSHHGLTVLAALFSMLVTVGLILAGMNALVR